MWQCKDASALPNPIYPTDVNVPKILGAPILNWARSSPRFVPSASPQWTPRLTRLGQRHITPVDTSFLEDFHHGILGSFFFRAEFNFDRSRLTCKSSFSLGTLLILLVSHPAATTLPVVIEDSLGSPGCPGATIPHSCRRQRSTPSAPAGRRMHDLQFLGITRLLMNTYVRHASVSTWQRVLYVVHICVFLCAIQQQLAQCMHPFSNPPSATNTIQEDIIRFANREIPSNPEPHSCHHVCHRKIAEMLLQDRLLRVHRSLYRSSLKIPAACLCE
jgi:hypothetical protein